MKDTIRSMRDRNTFLTDVEEAFELHPRWSPKHRRETVRDWYLMSVALVSTVIVLTGIGLAGLGAYVLVGGAL